jgi:hypothetical protein
MSNIPNVTNTMGRSVPHDRVLPCIEYLVGDEYALVELQDYCDAWGSHLGWTFSVWLAVAGPFKSEADLPISPSHFCH